MSRSDIEVRIDLAEEFCTHSRLLRDGALTWWFDREVIKLYVQVLRGDDGSVVVTIVRAQKVNNPRHLSGSRTEVSRMPFPYRG